MKVNLPELDRLHRAADYREGGSVGDFAKAKEASLVFRNEMSAVWPLISKALKAAQKAVSVWDTLDVYGPASADLDVALEDFKDAMEGRI